MFWQEFPFHTIEQTAVYRIKEKTQLVTINECATPPPNKRSSLGIIVAMKHNEILFCGVTVSASSEASTAAWLLNLSASRWCCDYQWKEGRGYHDGVANPTSKSVASLCMLCCGSWQQDALLQFKHGAQCGAWSTVWSMEHSVDHGAQHAQYTQRGACGLVVKEARCEFLFTASVVLLSNCFQCAADHWRLQVPPSAHLLCCRPLL